MRTLQCKQPVLNSMNYVGTTSMNCYYVIVKSFVFEAALTKGW